MSGKMKSEQLRWGSWPQVLAWSSGMLASGVAWYCWRWLRTRHVENDSGSLIGSYPMRPISAQQSEVDFCEVITEDRCTSAGVMYGGEILSSMDIAAGACAYKHCLHQGVGWGVVTASIEAVQFVGPAHPYELLRLHAGINAVFTTSMEIEVRVEVENVINGTVRECGVGRLVFVRLGGSPLPRLLIETDEDRRREAEAKARQKQAREESHDTANAGEEQWLELFEKEWAACSEEDHQGLPMEDTRVEVSKVVMPQHANMMGITFGGQVLAWMELAASMSATRLARAPVITVGLDRMRFRESSRVGSLLVMHSQVNRVFNSSIEVGVRVEAFQGSKSNVHCSTGYFTFTCVDPITKAPSSITRHVRPVHIEDKKRFYLAGKRRKRRLSEHR